MHGRTMNLRCGDLLQKSGGHRVGPSPTLILELLVRWHDNGRTGHKIFQELFDYIRSIKFLRPSN